MATASDNPGASNPTGRQRLRLGPRPLPQHLSLAAATWLNSGTILPALRLASMNWRRRARHRRQRESRSSRAPEAHAYQAQIRRRQIRPREIRSTKACAKDGRHWPRKRRGTDPAALAAALQAEGLRRFDQVLTRHRALSPPPAPPQRAPEAPVLWEQGHDQTARLPNRTRRHGRPGRAAPAGDPVAGEPLLHSSTSRRMRASCAGVQPRAWRLSSSTGRARRGRARLRLRRLHPAPGARARSRAREPGGPIFAVGYCMGGNLALALALRRQAALAGLILLATPVGLPRREQGTFLDAGGDRPRPGAGASGLRRAAGRHLEDLSSAASTRSRSCASSRASHARSAEPRCAEIRGARRLAQRRHRRRRRDRPRMPDRLVRREQDARNQWLVGGEPVDPRSFRNRR